jgi:PadR family transcriptional regulator, regulatory protein AphA
MDVKTLCLGLLAERPMTGYEIKKRFETGFRHFFPAGFGSIYPALAELAQAGLVTVESVEQDKRPDKKVHRVTETGHRVLVDELVATDPRHKVRSEFVALVYFAHLLPPERVTAVLDAMMRDWERVLLDDLAQADRPGADGACPELTPGMRFALEFGRTMVSTALDYVKQQKPQLLRELEESSRPAAARNARAAE